MSSLSLKFLFYFLFHFVVVISFSHCVTIFKCFLNLSAVHCTKSKVLHLSITNVSTDWGTLLLLRSFLITPQALSFLDLYFSFLLFLLPDNSADCSNGVVRFDLPVTFSIGVVFNSDVAVNTSLSVTGLSFFPSFSIISFDLLGNFTLTDGRVLFVSPTSYVSVSGCVNFEAGSSFQFDSNGQESGNVTVRPLSSPFFFFYLFSLIDSFRFFPSVVPKTSPLSLQSTLLRFVNLIQFLQVHHQFRFPPFSSG